MTSRKKRSADNASANRFRLPSCKTIVVSSTTLVSVVTLLCLKNEALFTRPASSIADLPRNAQVSIKNPTVPPATPSVAPTSEQETHARSFILVTSSAPTPIVQWFLLPHRAAPVTSSSPVINAVSNASIDDPLLFQSLTSGSVAPLPSVASYRSRTARQKAPASPAEPPNGLKVLVQHAAKRFVALLRRTQDVLNLENQDLRQLLEQQEQNHRQALKQLLEQQEQNHRQALQQLLEEQERKQRQALKLQKREKDLQRRFQLRQVRQARVAERERSKAIRVEREWRLYLAVPTGESDLVVYQDRAFGLPGPKREECNVWEIVLLYASIFGISLAGTASWETDEGEPSPIDQQLLVESVVRCDEDDHDTPTSVVKVITGAESITASPVVAKDLKIIVEDPVARQHVSREILHVAEDLVSVTCDTGDTARVAEKSHLLSQSPAAANRHLTIGTSHDVTDNASVRDSVTSNAIDRSDKFSPFFELSSPIICLLPKKSFPSQGTCNEDAETAIDAAEKVRQEVLFTSESWYEAFRTKTIHEHDSIWDDEEEVISEKGQRKPIQEQLENSPSQPIPDDSQDITPAKLAWNAQVDAQDLALVISELAEEVLPDPTGRNSLEVPGTEFIDEVETTVDEPHVQSLRLGNPGVSTKSIDELFADNPIKVQGASLKRSENENDAREGAEPSQCIVEGALSKMMIAEGMMKPKNLENRSREQGIEIAADAPVQDDGEAERIARLVHEDAGVADSSSSRNDTSHVLLGALVQPRQIDDEAEKVEALGASENAPYSPPNEIDDEAEKVEVLESSEHAPCLPPNEIDDEAEKVEALESSENAPCLPPRAFQPRIDIRRDSVLTLPRHWTSATAATWPVQMPRLDHAPLVDRTLGTDPSLATTSQGNVKSSVFANEASGVTFPSRVYLPRSSFEARASSFLQPRLPHPPALAKVDAKAIQGVKVVNEAKKVEARTASENAPYSPPNKIDDGAEKVEALGTSEHAPCLPPRAFQPRIDIRRDSVLTLPRHWTSATAATWPVRMPRPDHAPLVDRTLGTDPSLATTSKGNVKSSVFANEASGVTFPSRVYLPRSSFEARASSFLQSRLPHPPALAKVDAKAAQAGSDALFPCAAAEDLDRDLTNAPHTAQEQQIVDEVDERQQHVDARTSSIVDDNSQQEAIDAARFIEQRIVPDVNAIPTGVNIELQQTADQDIANGSVAEAKRGKTRRGCRGSGKKKKAKRGAEAQAKNTQAAPQAQRLPSNDRPTQPWNSLQAQFLPPPTVQFTQQPAQASRYRPPTSFGAYGQMVNAYPNFAQTQWPYMGIQRPRAMPQLGSIAFASPFSRPLCENHVQNRPLAHFLPYLPNPRPLQAANAFAWGPSVHQSGQGSRPQPRSKPLVADDPTDYDVSGYVFRHSGPRLQDVAEPALSASQSDPSLHAPERGKSSYTGHLRSGTVKSIS